MNDIRSYLKNSAQMISERLGVLLNDNMECVVSDAMKYSVKNGGKRIRPFLSLEFAKLCNGNIAAAIDLGCAVEMIHTYSLIHDDLPCMDNDNMRRGKPSCHIAYGEDNALLAGDALLTLAFKTVSGIKGIPCENLMKSVSYLSEFAGINGMVGGQVLDLQFEEQTPSAEEILKMYSLKTCGLLKAAAVLGCLCSENCDEKIVKSAAEYAENLGLAFQITDDILDIKGDEKLLGKPVGSDEENQKSTVIRYFGIEKAEKMVDEYTDRAISVLNDFDGDADVLKEFTLLMAKRNY